MAPSTLPNRKSELRLVWNPKQSRFLKSTAKYLNLEGGIRAGKSFALCFKILYYCITYPGIHCALTRWTQDGLDAQLRPIWRLVCRMAGVALEWHPDEEYDKLPNGSLVYLRALKSSEETQRYSKLAGLTLAILGIDQAEECPEDVYRHYVPARLSQPGFPHQVLITPNPPDENSFIAKDWPEAGGDPDHELVHTTPYDNRVVLGDEYIADLEKAYPPGSFEHRRLVEGKRGLMVAGTPIFGRHFRDSVHVPTVPVQFKSTIALCESWDYGSRHPCVTWCQFWPTGHLVVLGGVTGSDFELEQFVPIVAEYRDRWFPGLQDFQVQQTCDPAGDIRNAQGTQTAITMLQSHGIYPVVHANANHPPVKDGAIRSVVGYLSRSQPDGSPCLLMNPRFVIVSERERRDSPLLQNAFAAGYVYDEKRNYQGTTYPHLRPPKKDGWYEHPCDSLLYSVTAFAPSDAAEQAGVVLNPKAAKDARKVLEATGHPHASDGDVRRMASEIVAARAQQQQAKLTRRALRAAQRDDRDLPRDMRDRSTWQRAGVTHSFGRSGY